MKNTKLPKEYLSYSQYALWNSNKDAYRRRYYLNEKSPETAETIFGKKVGRYLEELDKTAVTDEEREILNKVERYSKPEYKIEIDLEGTKLLGYLDSFDPKKKRFLEYKTSHKNKQGEDYWTHKKVQNHEQLDFYSLLVEMKHGKVQDDCKLVYMETEVTPVTYKGRETGKRHISLNGEIKVFERTVEDWERTHIKEKILKTIKEIEEDYAKFKKDHKELF